MFLATVISQYRTVLSRFGEVVSFDISALDRLGVPVTSCSLAVDGRLKHHGNGYGATPEAAEVSGLGELAENVMSALDLADRHAAARTGSYAELVAAEGRDRVADPRTLGLPAGSPYDAAMPLVWLPMTRRATGETVLVPEDFVASGPSEVRGPRRLITPISNGRGAGLDDEQAFHHGLFELLQRHTNGLRFRALDRRSPVIRPETLPDAVRTLADRLAAQGVRPVLKHAANELGVVSTYAMGVDPSPGQGILVTAGGEAAHPSAEVSLIKALLEYANSRVRKAFFFGDPQAVRAVAPEAYWAKLDSPGRGEARAYEAMTAWRDLPHETLRELTAPDESRAVDYAGIAAPDRTPVQALAGYDVLVARKEVDGVVAVKVVVPGLEVETLSYGRIGEAGVRDSLAGGLDLVRVQAQPSGTHTARVLLTPEAEERLGGPVWYSYAVADDIVGPLYPLYREPPRHSVAV
ncbi:YcaO-like family protein [Paractinoplanes lichenicola]|uniref:YcaO-like family protein n=1 Tax=Paractinoplanes lichenicola TaxID=2802976 RepID=A0ABS1VFU1_9ACTN|nr:YcaO-like family protein [Actinoplanes lichenicola]MBL7253498.1 YcaO-like family protein [Actinoplanes lichenicola]